MNKNEIYTEFMSSTEVSPSLQLTNRILSIVQADLNPAVWRVFTKLGFLQLVVGAIVLLFCPQFGIRVLPGMGLMTLFARLGEFGCMMSCGVVFLGASSLIGSMVLRPEEIKVIRRSRLLLVGVMALLSGGVFVCLGGDQVITLGIAWVLGGLLGGLGTLELAWLTRLWSVGMLEN